MLFKDVEFDEDRYPMSYKEFEKRVVELFLEDYCDDVLEEMNARVEEELSNEVSYIDGFYGDTAFVYDHPELYGDTCKKAFEDYYLKETPVANLRKLIG